MSEPVRAASVAERVARAWDRFWFAPTGPLVPALMRIGVGVWAVVVLSSYTADFSRWFDPRDGMLPVETVRWIAVELDRTARFSYLDYLADPTSLSLVHFAGMIVAALTAIGWKSRATSALAGVVLLSYYHRSAATAEAVLPLIGCCALYLSLGPCGRVLSLDARLARRAATGGLPRTATADSRSTVSVRLIQLHAVLFLMQWPAAMFAR